MHNHPARTNHYITKSADLLFKPYDRNTGLRIKTNLNTCKFSHYNVARLLNKIRFSNRTRTSKPSKNVDSRSKLPRQSSGFFDATCPKVDVPDGQETQEVWPS